MFTPMRRVRGITLIEMMMALAVLAIVLATAMPAFGKLIQSTKAQTTRSTVTAALNTARIFAVSRALHVVMCPSDDQRYCGHTTEWQHGWLIFVDADHDGVRDDSEELLSVSQALPDAVAVVTSAGRTHVDYRPDGSAPGSNVTFTVCDARGSEEATSLVINNAGRIRTGVPTSKAAAACEEVLATPSA
jgi:type IV fimbrial biogenesis protein FimT